MTGASCAVVPLRAHPAYLTDTQEALSRLNVPFHIELDPESLTREDRTDLSLVIAQGPASQRMVNLVRTVSAARPSVRILAFVRHLTEELETTLLHAGAHDVLEIPASSARVEARLRAAFRHVVQHDHTPLLHRGALTIHLGRREVTYLDSPVHLTKIEFDLLATLAQRPRHVLSRDELTHQAIGRDYMGDRALESHISRLRAKIRVVGGPRLIEPVRGVGYRLGVC